MIKQQVLLADTSLLIVSILIETNWEIDSSRDREGFDTKHNKPCVTLCQVFYTSQTFHFLEIAQNDSNEAEYSGGIALGECEGMTISLKRARD